MGLFGWMCSHKLLLLLIAATAAFGIATITLAVEKSDLKDDLALCQSNPEGTTTPGAESTSEDPTETTTPSISTTVSTTTTTEAPSMEDYRLPEHIVPRSYNIYLYPDLTSEESGMKGEVTVIVDVKEDSTEIKMHAKNLVVATVTLDGEAANFKAKAEYDLIVITRQDKTIEKGDHTIIIGFTGRMDGMVGLYRSFYTAENGDKRAIATSKFEPTYARLAFPCFDEPAMKAEYTVRLEKPKNVYIALSNMPEATKEDNEENPLNEIVTFEKSVRMSTYLICFIVCDFDYDSAIIHSPISFRQTQLKVYSTPAQVAKTKYALETALKVTEYFIKYFNIEYPLPKLDLIAIPDFISGAMEHWGLVTFRETALLFDEATSSTVNQQRVAGVVAHELAHSWFGNLVTMQWWNDLWLNEGFATFIAGKGVHAVHNNWDMLDQFLIEDLHTALSVDATPASHPIVTNVVTPNQITEVFDSITYKKGASILRMLEGAITEDIFKKGVTAYLNNHNFGNAVTQDLWDEIQKLVKPETDITKFMNTWTEQMGYPIITIKEEGGPITKRKYVLTQERFLKDKENSESPPSPHNYKWTIPITYITDTTSTPEQVWFDLSQDSISIDKPSGIKWIKFNHDQFGYYRVNYPEAMWKVLTATENIKTMTVADKTHLLEESFSIAESGKLAYDVPLELTKYLAEEKHFIPWSAAAAKLEQLKKHLTDSLQYNNYLKYVDSIVKPAYTDTKWEVAPTEHLEKRARVVILDLACSVNDGDCLQKASEHFTKWILDPTANAVEQDLRSIVYKYGLQQHGKEEWDEVFKRFKDEIDANEKMILMRALASVQDPWLLKRMIIDGQDKAVVRDQDYLTLLQYISANPIGTPIVWDFVREEWQLLVDRYGLDDRYLGRLIPAITSSFATNTKRKEMEAFFKENPEAGAGKTAREEALTNVIYNINWVVSSKPIVEKWIEDNTNTSPK